MPQLSIVIITLNEERNITRCLASVKGIADEILVVDSFSTDKTKEIAEANGAIVVQHKFDGHIEQKNWALSQAKYPFILSLDADEALSEQLRVSIMEVKNNKQYDGYTMNRFTNYCGKWVRHCGWYPDTKLRLFDRTVSEWGGVNPHDKLEIEADAKVFHLKGDILHYSYYTLADHINQVNKFTEISANALFKIGKKASLFKIKFSPLKKFTRDYIFKLGFLDGYTGFVISRISAHAAFLKYAKLRQLNKSKARQNNETNQ
jgi:glycosyltransferase involved in cell wall biosynthesis